MVTTAGDLLKHSLLSLDSRISTTLYQDCISRSVVLYHAIYTSSSHRRQVLISSIQMADSKKNGISIPYMTAIKDRMETIK